MQIQKRLNRFQAIFVLVVFVSPLFSYAAAQEKRVALVIGNSTYEHVSNLPNPKNDANDIGVALGRIGFSVTTHLDLDYRSMRLAIRDFAEEASDADMAFVYFAGHGIEIDGANYLIPVNAELGSDRDVEFEAIRLDTVLSSVTGVQGVKVILVDACRNNPFLSDMVQTSAKRSVGRGLGRIDPGGVLVGYAARSGTLAMDGEGRNSPYAKALLQHIEEPGLELGKLFRRVRDTVFELTEGYQEPFTYGSLPGKDIFLKPPVQLAAASNDTAAAASLKVLQKMAEDFAKASDGNTISAWNRFLSQYSDQSENSIYKIALARRDAVRVPVAQPKPEAEPTSKSAAAAVPVAKPPPLLQNVEEVALDVTRSVARKIQLALNVRGFNAGTTDGILGKKSQQAIEDFKSKSGLPETDLITTETLTALRIDPSRELVDRKTFISGKRAKRYSPAEGSGLNDDPRLQKIVENLGSSEIIYGYFENRLYVATKASIGGTWESNARNALRLGGHLVTITSEAENDFVYEMIRHEEKFWKIYSDRKGAQGPAIGLFQPKDAPEPRGGWRWVTGEPLTYTNWGRSEPNDHQGREDHAFYASSTRGNRRMTALETSSSWNDASGFGSAIVMEFP
ncbi:caspase family protein [Sulfitobacter sp. SK011]|uniref:caspase family protein n=1 Tax=Sulfitobacter sp. SK011 TaxID=1389004 RepID=UPI000E0AFEDB|nr:caspase family protein [Sulfitobacter sp. SK011]AXI41342.1 hypothetical protein C1J02_04740 [Sulfitobacter sp. SK011]